MQSLEIAHSYGERMLLHDAASRGYSGVIADVCSAIGVKPRRVDPMPRRAVVYLEAAVAAAKQALEHDPATQRDTRTALPKRKWLQLGDANENGS